MVPALVADHRIAGETLRHRVPVAPVGREVRGDGFGKIECVHRGLSARGHLHKDMVAVRLTPDIPLLAVASPDHLATHGEPGTPADLHRHACINWSFPGSGRIAEWQFGSQHTRMDVAVAGPLVANQQDLVVAAALEGLGICYVYDEAGVTEAMARGRLRRVLADWSPTLPGLYLYYPSARHMRPALRAFIDCLLDRDAEA